MAYELFIGVIIFIFLMVASFILMKKFFKIMLTISLVSLIIFSIFGYFLYKDIMDMQDGFKNSNSLVLLEDNGEILAGIKFGQETGLISEEEFNFYNENIGNLEKLNEGYHKIILVKIEVLETLEELEFLDKRINGEDAIEILRSDKPYLWFFEEGSIEKISLGDEEIEITDSLNFKATFFGFVFTKEIMSNPLSLFIYYKQDYVRVYPETIIFKVIKKFPTSLLKRVLSNAKNKVEEKVKEKIESFE